MNSGGYYQPLVMKVSGSGEPQSRSGGAGVESDIRVS
jgi:hypothetical protein